MICFGRKVCMHLVTWVEVVTLSRDAKVDTLVTTFVKGEMVAPGTYHDILPQVSPYAPASSQPGFGFINNM